MTKFFFDDSKITTHSLIGFDVDGTLYDEFDFIKQAYFPIAEYLTYSKKIEKNQIYNILIDAWKKYGSSKTNLFQTVCEDNSVDFDENDLKCCVKLFRESSFNIDLYKEWKEIFDILIANGCSLYIFTDGNSTLQRKKIKSLNLTKWFNESNIFISGDYGKTFYKPSSLIYEKIKLNIDVESFERKFYIGDRIVDKLFADAIGSNFLDANSMLDKWRKNGK